MASPNAPRSAPAIASRGPGEICLVGRRDKIPDTNWQAKARASQPRFSWKRRQAEAEWVALTERRASGEAW
jgi:hypothetical protein